MFDFGKDLRRLFTHARAGDDLGWLELIAAPLLEGEARRRSADAGRVSCKTPAESALKAAAVWREHARRTGRADSIARALDLAADAGRDATGADGLAEAMLDAALTTIVDHDLRGGAVRLARAKAFIEGAKTGRGATLKVRVAAAQARLAARAARLSGEAGAVKEAADGLDHALHGLDSRPGTATESVEARLDRAALALENGMRLPDPKLLDQAGRDLRVLVERASPDYLPLTRARALTLCAVGLGRLAQMAGSQAAHGQARQMFEAASDAFTHDHSPLDWVAVQLARLGAGRTVDAEALARAEALTAAEGLVLGALVREARTAAEVRAAELTGDTGALDAVALRLHRRLRLEDAVDAPLDWVADQIGLAETARARRHLLDAAISPEVRLALKEAADVAREEGAEVLAERADRLALALGQHA